MMINKQMLNKWRISYSPYSDVFQFYDELVFHISRDSMEKTESDRVSFLHKKDTGKPLLLEIKNAYDVLKVDIDQMAKKDIINLVILFLKEKYDQKKRTNH